MTDYLTLNVIRDGEHVEETTTYVLDTNTELGQQLIAFIEANKLGEVILGSDLTPEYIGRRVRIEHHEFGCETRTSKNFYEGGPWREGVLTDVHDDGEVRYFSIDGVEYYIRIYSENEIIVLPA